ncbi:MAG: hypothetical protein WC670_10210, partial [Pseudolabrys sp.]
CTITKTIVHRAAGLLWPRRSARPRFIECALGMMFLEYGSPGAANNTGDESRLLSCAARRNNGHEDAGY